MELRIIKNDLLKELQSESYYNEQEIARLATQDTINHKERIQQIAFLVKENAKVIDAMSLIDKVYFPNAQPQQSAQPIADQAQQPAAQ